MLSSEFVKTICTNYCPTYCPTSNAFRLIFSGLSNLADLSCHFRKLFLKTFWTTVNHMPICLCVCVCAHASYIILGWTGWTSAINYGLSNLCPTSKSRLDSGEVGQFKTDNCNGFSSVGGVA
jgi:hypothetical protein